MAHHDKHATDGKIIATSGKALLAFSTAFATIDTLVATGAVEAASLSAMFNTVGASPSLGTPEAFVYDALIGLLGYKLSKSSQTSKPYTSTQQNTCKPAQD